MTIQLLPDEVASQIAAGEVVERPASVVKELIENSLDAGASTVNVIVEGAGKTRIEVADNGHGISSSELKLAVTRHATSKLKSKDDLFNISTLGFRGEALASISSVSHFRITSRPVDQEFGYTIDLDGGKILESNQVGAPVGTSIRVSDLFFNVPARLKFLKTDRTERGKITGLITKYALAYPDVKFQLKHDNRVTIQTSGNGNSREVLGKLFSPEIAKQMIPVVFDEEIKVSGFISPTSITRSNRRGIHFFINGRPIQDTTLNTAAIKAYHTMLMVGRYPLMTLMIEMNPTQVDVNVHPTKAEVRFRDRDQVFRSVGRAVRRALLASTPVPGLGQTTSSGLGIFQVPDWGGIQRSATPAISSGESGEEPPESVSPIASPGEGSQPGLEELGSPILRLMGQVAATYLIAEGPDGLYLIDQHAAHERVLFEKMMNQKDTRIPSQTLLEPVPVELTANEAVIIEENLERLNSLGFIVDEFGQLTFIVRAIPIVLFGMNPASALRVIVEDFEEDEAPLQKEVEMKLIARVCKKAAVKAGQILTQAEQAALIRDLEACQAPRTCPHGRPTMVRLSVELLERQFGRKGSR